MQLLILPRERVGEYQAALGVAEAGPRVRLLISVFLPFGDSRGAAVGRSQLRRDSCTAQRFRGRRKGSHIQLATVIPCGNVYLGEIAIARDLDVGDEVGLDLDEVGT